MNELVIRVLNGDPWGLPLDILFLIGIVAVVDIVICRIIKRMFKSKTTK